MPFPAASVLLGTPLLRAGAHPPGASCPDHQTLPDPQPITLSQSSSSIAVPHSSCRTLLGGCGPLPRGQAVPTGPPTGQSAGPCPARPGSACVAGFQRGSRSSADPWEREVGNSPETSEPSCDEGPGLRLPARGRAAARWPFPAEATPAELGGEVPAAGVRPSLQSPVPAPHPALHTPCPSTSLPTGPLRCQHLLGPRGQQCPPWPGPAGRHVCEGSRGSSGRTPPTHHPTGPRVSHPLWATPSLLLAPHLFTPRELAPGAPSSATCSAHRLTLPAFRPRQPCRACPLALPPLLTADP